MVKIIKKIASVYVRKTREHPIAIIIVPPSNSTLSLGNLTAFSPSFYSLIHVFTCQILNGHQLCFGTLPYFAYKGINQIPLCVFEISQLPSSTNLSTSLRISVISSVFVIPWVMIFQVNVSFHFSWTYLTDITNTRLNNGFRELYCQVISQI